MDWLRQMLGPSHSINVREVLDAHMKDLPVLKQLDMLTELLTASSEADERFAEVIYAAWSHVCENNLWSFKYESLEQYQQFISYSDIVKPIIHRFKRSDRAKFTSISIIKEYWGMSVTDVIPKEMAPYTWSKHLLSLLGSLSKKKSRDEAVSLLADSIRQRPQRSRHVSYLIPSDVQRVLDGISCSRGSEKQPLSDGLPSTEPDTSNYTPIDILPDVLDDVEEQGCQCSPICFPLMILMSMHMPLMRDELVMGLFRWAQGISWSSLCLHHLKCLASYKLGDDAYFLPQAEIIHRIEQLLLEDLTFAQYLASSIDIFSSLSTI